MAKILSTKLLSERNQERLLSGGHQFTHFDQLIPELLPFALPEYPVYICSSQNAVKALTHYWKAQPSQALQEADWYCVGEQTRTALESLGIKVVHSADSAEDLIDLTLKAVREPKLWLTGIRKTPATLAYLQSKEADYIDVYLVNFNARSFEQKFDGLLFFSPSGIEAFMKNNTISLETPVFCIGDSTSKEAKHLGFQTILSPSKPGADHLIDQVLLYYKNLNNSSSQ